MDQRNLKEDPAARQEFNVKYVKNRNASRSVWFTYHDENGSMHVVFVS